MAGCKYTSVEVGVQIRELLTAKNAEYAEDKDEKTCEKTSRAFSVCL
jgi:hypothetical protein